MDDDVHVAVLFNRFGPYHRARLKAAGQKMEVTGVEVVGKASTYAWDEVDAAPTFNRVTLFPETDRSNVSNLALRQAIARQLDEIAPDAVAAPGWSYPGALGALQWCIHTGVPAVVMSETTASDFPRRWWTETIKRRIVSQFGAGLVGGTPHRAYLHELGVPEERIFLGYDVVENEYFTEGAQNGDREEKTLRSEYALPDHYFLASCRFVPKKNLSRLINAFGQYRDRAADEAWDLVLLGDGPERDSVEQAITTGGLSDAVQLPGFKQYNELPTYYGLAGAFVHASTREQWGLVVNEAMAAGLPVLVSDRCGCAPDLVEEGRNGYTFDPYEPSSLADRMYQVAHGSVDLQAMGTASRSIISQWGPDRFAQGLRRAVAAALDAGPPSSSIFDRLLLKGLMYR
jgi:glycosyltransferase involved in cell wall biosynthesis